jgi:Gram-negative porin
MRVLLPASTLDNPLEMQMNGALMNATSRIAILAAAGLTLSISSASAADLGGNCCADLEERVAELEATTARKGNRKMSVTIYGQVNRAILYWNDGRRQNTFVGLDNHNSASRFGFMGSAKISPTWSAGYSILVDWGDKARTSGVSQRNEEGGPRSNPNNTDSLNGDGFLRFRDVNFWIEAKDVGRLTVGRITNSGQNGLIDLAGTTPGVGSDWGCDGGGLAFRRRDNNLLAAGTGGGGFTTTMSSLTAGCGGPFAIRMEGIKYTSPTVMGFILDASVGEALKVETSTVDNPTGSLTNLGRVMGINLKYAGEFNGFRIAAGVGAEWSRSNEDDSFNFVSTVTAVTVGSTTFGVIPTNASADNVYWAAALSLMHVPSGLFAQGHYTGLNIAAQNPLLGTYGQDKDAHRWDIQAGVAKNYFGIGNTVLYGEYGQYANFKWAGAVFGCTNATASPGGGACTTTAAPSQIKGDSLSMWGLGVVQNLDAAATELYVSWRHFDAKDPGTTSTPNPGLKDLDIIVTGARVKF